MHSSEYYKRLFDAVESTLIETGIQNGIGDMRQQLAGYKTVAERQFEDADYYGLIVEITFYSGFLAATVDAKWHVINEWLPDYATVARYESEHVQKMMADPRMIRNKSKLWACIKNARIFQRIVNEHGSFQKYVDSFAPKASFQNLMTLRDDLMERFAYLAETNSLYFLMEIGMPVLKPDSVVIRIFHRLGFIEDETINETRRFECVETGQRFAEATGHPIRYVDIVFVLYGEVSGDSRHSIQQGICLSSNPRCNVCGVTAFCNYFNAAAEKKLFPFTARPQIAPADTEIGIAPLDSSNVVADPKDTIIGGCNIECYVEPLSQHYADGLERVELYVRSEFTASVPQPEKGQRMPLTLSTPHGVYQGGLRKLDGWVYVCPDLVTSSGSRVSLARILRDNGISPRERVSVRVAGRHWELAKLS